jgi:hypothetical protein
MLKIEKLLRTNLQGFYEIGQIAKASNTKHEMIENVAIFDFYRVVTEHFLEEYPEGKASVLDIGGGPTIYQHIGLSLIAGHITHSEFLEKNRREVLKWLSEEKGAHIWDAYFKLVQQMFHHGEVLHILSRQMKSADLEITEHAKMLNKLLSSKSIDEFKKLVQTRINNDVVYGDMFDDMLGLEKVLKPFDIITCNFVAESASENFNDWQKAMQNIMKHVSTKGYFVQTAIKNAAWYQVGQERLPAFSVTPEDISKECEKQGFRIIYQKVLEGSRVEMVGYDGMIFTLAKKLA